MYYNKAFLKFRFLQAGKIVREIPVPYLLMLVIMCVFLVCGLYTFMDSQSRAAMVGGVFLLLIGILHIRRGDYHFIELVEERPERLFCVDYCLLSMPVLTLEIVRGYYLVALGIGLGCLLVSFKKQPIHRVKNGIQAPRFIPKEAFECRAAIRKQGIWLLLFYGSAYLGVLFPYVSLALLWLFTCMLAECFVYAEPTTMLCLQELPASRFLHRKLSLYIRLYTLAIAPVCLLYILLHPSQWWLVLLFAISGILNVALMVVSKYAAYLPNTRIQAGQIAISLSLFGILLPPLAPLTLLFLIKKYKAARHHLTSYLYAYN